MIDFMDLKLHLWLISKTLKKKTKQNKTKQRREIHTCNSLNGRFDNDFYHGFHNKGELVWETATPTPLFGYWTKLTWMGGIVLLPLKMEVRLIIFPL